MADNDYTFGTRNEPPFEKDNRADYRLTARARAVLELESGLPEEETPEARDALLPASVSLGNHNEPFTLMVEVVWCRPNESGFLVGVRIIESDETAYVEWVEAVASAMDQG